MAVQFPTQAGLLAVLKSRHWICHIDPAHGSRRLHAHRRSPEGHLPERPRVRNEGVSAVPLAYTPLHVE